MAEHKEEGFKISNPFELQLALNSKINKASLSNDFIIKYGPISDDKIKYNNELLIPTLKSIFLFYQNIQANKLDFNILSSVYKGASPSFSNLYLQADLLTENQIPFNIAGARALFSDVSNIAQNLFTSLNNNKVSYTDLTNKYNFYDISGNWVSPTDTKKALDLVQTSNMYKELYENKVSNEQIGHTYIDDTATSEGNVVQSTSKITDSKSKLSLFKVASEFSVRQLYVNLNNKIKNIINSSENKERIINLSTQSIKANSLYTFLPLNKIHNYSSYLITFFYELSDTVSNIEMFRVVISKNKTNSKYVKIFNLSKNRYEDNIYFIELVYDDTNGLNYKINNIGKTSNLLFKIKIYKELENSL